MEQGINMWKQILLICVGAFISILATAISKFVDSWLNKQGDVIIYRKLVYQKNSTNKSMGVYDEHNETVLVVPLWIEIQNTKKIPIIIRDFSLELYKDGNKIKKMRQITHEKSGNSEPEIYYGDNGRYSFLIQPESIMRYNLLYALKRNECKLDFDEIKISYYNSNNRQIIKKFKEIRESWKSNQLDIDEDWIKLY